MSKHENWYQKIPGEKFTHPIPKNPGEVFGFCNFAQFYLNTFNELPENSTIVEIGTSAGCSTAWMTSFIRGSGKPMNFYSIDPLPDLYGEEAFGTYSQEFDVPMYQLFLRNMKSMDLLRYVNHLRMDHAAAADLFEDDSIDFVFLDGDHGTEATERAIDKWLPKINKKTGIIAGHDYDWDTVKQAVANKFQFGIETWGTCWIRRFKKDASITVSELDFSDL